MEAGLYLVATPIGNLADMSERAIEVLNQVDTIACEDTRHSQKLLQHYNIKKPLMPYHEHNQYDKINTVLKAIESGKAIALISDAGTPGISDPGTPLVKACHEAGLYVTAIPGPAAFVQALILSGFSTNRFIFDGFLPTGNKALKEHLEALAIETRTMIFYEAPHRLIQTLQALQIAMPARPVAVIKELTKRFETVYRGTLETALIHYNANPPKGEYVIVLEGLSKTEKAKVLSEGFMSITIEAHMSLYLKQGYTKKEAIKAIAKDRQMDKRTVYDFFINS